MASYEEFCRRRGIPFVKPEPVEVIMEEDLKPVPKKPVSKKPPAKKKSNATKKKA
tara:strand:- start:231 stop:395 length:165 start_codon:yes stop_codon:yes gene_type:complete